MFGSLVGGCLFDLTGSYQASFIMGAAAAFFGVYLSWRHL